MDFQRDPKNMTTNEIESRVVDLQDEVDDLEEEIHSREIAMPKMLPDSEINDKLVRKYVKEYIINLHRDGGSKDFKHYLYESIMETYYGKEIWDWINKYQKW